MHPLILQDIIQTETATLQDQTEQICLPYLTKEVNPKLDQKTHVEYLLNILTNPLPKSYLTLDASRPWIIYWTLCAYALLGQSVEEYRERTIQSISALQLESGGFSGGHGQIAHLAPTYAAVMALCIVGSEEAYDTINRSSLYCWIMRLKQSDGSFVIHEGGEKDARAVYCALSVASLLNLMTPELIEGTAVWLSRCQTYEGGLSGFPGAEAHGGYAFCVLASLSMIGKPNMIFDQYLNISKLMRWLAFRQSSIEGGFSGRTNKLVDGCYSWWVGGCWAILSSVMGDIRTPLIDKDALRRFILTCCQYKTGGLRDKPEKYPDQYHTCYCISGLSVIQNVYFYSEKDKKDTALGESVFNWHHDHLIEQSIFTTDQVKAVHPILAIPMDKLYDIWLWRIKKGSI